MNSFWLIQRGNFVKSNKGLLTGTEHIIRLQYMNSTEFEFGAIPKAYRRILFNSFEYGIFPTGIFTPEHENLYLFCRKNLSTDIIEEITQFVKNPYQLRRYSELEKVPIFPKDDTTFNHRNTDFWWCIDIKPYGDWMAFLQPQKSLFEKGFKYDHDKWWLKKSFVEREREYQKSLYW